MMAHAASTQIGAHEAIANPRSGHEAAVPDQFLTLPRKKMQVHCRNFGVVFRSENSETRALTRVSFTTADREFVSILGRSGCGKTTLLRCIAGLHRPTEGSVELIPSPHDSNHDALMVSQHDGLFPWMHVLENAAFGLQMKGVGRVEREERGPSKVRSSRTSLLSVRFAAFQTGPGTRTTSWACDVANMVQSLRQMGGHAARSGPLS